MTGFSTTPVKRGEITISFPGIGFYNIVTVFMMITKFRESIEYKVKIERWQYKIAHVVTLPNST